MDHVIFILFKLGAGGGGAGGGGGALEKLRARNAALRGAIRELEARGERTQQELDGLLLENSRAALARLRAVDAGLRRREAEAVAEIDQLARSRSASVVAEVTERVAVKQQRLASQVLGGADAGEGSEAGDGGGGRGGERWGGLLRRRRGMTRPRPYY